MKDIDQVVSMTSASSSPDPIRVAAEETEKVRGADESTRNSVVGTVADAVTLTVVWSTWVTTGALTVASNEPDELALDAHPVRPEDARLVGGIGGFQRDGD